MKYHFYNIVAENENASDQRPATADLQFRRRHRGSAASRGYAMNWMMPELPTKAPARDWALAERYTRVTKAIDEDWPDAHSAWLTIGPQHFKVADCETKEEAGWHCWMLAKAMRAVIDSAVTGVPIAGPTVA